MQLLMLESFLFFLSAVNGGGIWRLSAHTASITIVNSNMSIVPAVSVMENNHNDSAGASAKLRNISLRAEG